MLQDYGENFFAWQSARNGAVNKLRHPRSGWTESAFGETARTSCNASDEPRGEAIFAFLQCATKSAASVECLLRRTPYAVMCAVVVRETSRLPPDTEANWVFRCLKLRFFRTSFRLPQLESGEGCGWRSPSPDVVGKRCITLWCRNGIDVSGTNSDQQGTKKISWFRPKGTWSSGRVYGALIRDAGDRSLDMAIRPMLGYACLNAPRNMPSTDHVRATAAHV